MRHPLPLPIPISRGNRKPALQCSSSLLSSLISNSLHPPRLNQMVASSNGDVYAQFPHGIIVDDGPQSSEDGSGLHSPIFGAHFPHSHGDSIRYHHDRLDIHSAAGVLASQFDYKSIQLSVPQPSHHVYDDQLDIHPATQPHQPSPYSQDYPIAPRNHLGLDISPHSYHGTRLPLSSALGGGPGLSYHLPAPHRRYSDDVSRDNSYPTCAPASPPIVPESDQRTIIPKREPEPQPLLQPAPAPPPQQPPQQQQSGAQSNPRRESSNLVIACRQCRARKIRCDSTRPICHNCVRRSNECQYDAVPKRRGPDKRPGTRQRSCKKRPADGSTPVPPSKRKKAGTWSGNPQAEVQAQRIGLEHNVIRTQQDTGNQPPQPSLSPRRPELSLAQARTLPDSYATQPDKSRGASTPVIQYDPKEAWSNLLGGYSKTREESMDDIVNDLSLIFTTRGHWLPVINVRDLVQRLFASEDRSLSQLCLIFAGLAVTTLMKSSEMGLSTAGQNRAAWLRDQAYASLEASWSSQLIDINLARAALMLAIYESSAHPLYTPERERKSLLQLDHIIRSLGLAFMDSNEPDVSTFTPNTVPAARRRLFGATGKDDLHSHPSASKCTCTPSPSNPTMISDPILPFWTYVPPCNPLWTADEVDKEDCRRLCWSALSLVASYTSRCIASRKEPSGFFMADPSNFRLLFPGEASERGSSDLKAQSPKDSIWALYCRSMLLWNFCTTRLRQNTFTSDETADIALQAWREAQEIQDALDSHNCGLDMTLLYMCREYVYNIQMLITSALQSFHGPGAGHLPSFTRKHAEQWLRHLGYFVSRVPASVKHMGDSCSDSFASRPFQVTWLASQISMCLLLWENDRSLIEALEVAKDILGPLELLNTLWPCPMLQSTCDELRKRVISICHSTNIPPPTPTNSSFPISPRIRGG
ncbi:hypothetical protein F5J12DRAFT_799618 [Pisolithus orientalis]|uniref:uncharacterized protein n=1 Tax=Pisolithus orientalis TaxID=936130 RepID=UPI002224E233|nr:uncharacterized protein F5J12DRAFT_799618 [Pisolithus orientalis]KAI6033231.1 hypothetical protein F5J12DRAFT_799618 [Pisolithus orientalis]